MMVSAIYSDTLTMAEECYITIEAHLGHERVDGAQRK